MAEKIEQNECDKQLSELRKIDGIYKIIFLLLRCILSPRNIYYTLLSNY